MYFYIFAILLALPFRVLCSQNITVNLGYSQYQGIAASDPLVLKWLGMRYAAPPVGDLRFRAPASPNATGGIQNANAYGDVCLPSPSTGLTGGASEDCLFVNVYGPSDNSVLHPVFVFIQGGGFNTNSNPNLNGAGLIETADYDMVVVDFNYRVGPFGFLASQEVEEGGDLNAGLLDQRLLLQWVQTYISLFGGDPTRVTIGGDSAGASSICLHMTAYGGRDESLFSAAAVESQSFGAQLTVAEAQYQYDGLVSRTGCGTSSDTLACLRNLPIATLTEFDIFIPTPGSAGGTPVFMYGPVIDGDLIQGYTYNLFSDGKFIHVPTIWGDSTNEGTVFTPTDIISQTDMNNFLVNNWVDLTTAELAQIDLLYYPPSNIISSADASIAAAQISATSPFASSLSTATVNRRLASTSTSITCGIASPTPLGAICGSFGFSHDTTSTLIISYTSGPYVASANACGAQCLATSTCTNIYFIAGAFCNLHSGTETFQPSTSTGYYSFYESQCFSCSSTSSPTQTTSTPSTSTSPTLCKAVSPTPPGAICGSSGFSHDTTSQLLVSYTSGPFVVSAAACGTQCLSTSTCTNFYFIQGQFCNLHFGTETFQPSTATGFYAFYESQCFSCGSTSTTTSAGCAIAAPTPSGSICGSFGFSHDITSTLIVSYTSGPYVTSAAACAAQCFAMSTCTNLYFIAGAYCNLHSGTETFAPSTATGYYSFYEIQCFSCSGVRPTSTSTTIIPTSTANPYWTSAAYAYGEIRYTCPGIFLANIMSQTTSPAYLYHWDVLEPGNIADGLGVVHAAEYAAIWGSLVYVAGSQTALVSPTIQNYWVSFIRTHNPNTEKLAASPTWEVVGSNMQRMHFVNDVATIAMETVNLGQQARCAYLNGIAPGLGL